jgi:nucleoside-diphosphate-sugar epimerase
MIQNALASRPTEIAHSASSRRQYVYGDDVVDSMLLALDRRNLPHFAYNIGGGSSLSLGKIANIVAEIVPGVRVSFGSDLAGEYRIGAIDPSLAERELGYSPKVSLHDGIARYAEWLKSHNGT